MRDFIPCACSVPTPHEPHFYQSFVTALRDGPIPTVTCLCPGVQPLNRMADTI